MADALHEKLVDEVIERLVKDGLAERVHTERGEEVKITELGRKVVNDLRRSQS